MLKSADTMESGISACVVATYEPRRVPKGGRPGSMRRTTTNRETPTLWLMAELSPVESHEQAQQWRRATVVLHGVLSRAEAIEARATVQALEESDRPWTPRRAKHVLAPFGDAAPARKRRLGPRVDEGQDEPLAAVSSWAPVDEPPAAVSWPAGGCGATPVVCLGRRVHRVHRADKGIDRPCAPVRQGRCRRQLSLIPVGCSTHAF